MFSWLRGTKSKTEEESKKDLDPRTNLPYTPEGGDYWSVSEVVGGDWLRLALRNKEGRILGEEDFPVVDVVNWGASLAMQETARRILRDIPDKRIEG